MRHDQGWGPATTQFEHWYRGQRRNPISRFLLTRYFEQGVPILYRMSTADRLVFLEDRLARFHFVGSWRRTDEMIAGISADLGIERASPAHNVTKTRAEDPITPSMADRILAENALDQTLFDRWHDRGWLGAPQTNAPGLATNDRMATLGRDLLQSVRKKIRRP